ncbi:hypothetical protein GJ496_007473 [Pomphorhynchus laevis]|nr:hypothetical protein GJ496_007473 [Pomphorhynchus laevis]
MEVLHHKPIHTLPILCTCLHRDEQKYPKLSLTLKIISLILSFICFLCTISAFVIIPSIRGAAVSMVIYVFAVVNIIVVLTTIFFFSKYLAYVPEVHDIVVTSQLIILAFIAALLCALNGIQSLALSIAAFFGFLLLFVLIAEFVVQLKNWRLQVCR